jgi:hypothetical protein
LGFACGFFGEVGVVEEELCFDVFERLAEVLLFLVIGAFTCGDGAVYTPIGIVGTECVVVAATSTALLGGVV